MDKIKQGGVEHKAKNGRLYVKVYSVPKNVRISQEEDDRAAALGKFHGEAFSELVRRLINVEYDALNSVGVVE